LSFSWNGETVRCLVSNAAGSVTSAPAILTVLRDTNPPVVVQAKYLGTTNVQIVYSKQVAAATATNLGHYVFTDGLPVTGAALQMDGVTVVLTTAAMTFGSNYWVVINGVQDLASPPNTIATNTTVTFLALPFASHDLGNPAVSSTVTAAGNGLNVTATGSDFGGSSDQGNFSGQLYSGNFDVSVHPRQPVCGRPDHPGHERQFLRVARSHGQRQQIDWRFPGKLSEQLAAAQPRGQHLHRLCQLRRPGLDPAWQRHDLDAQPDLSRLLRKQPHH
jgi:hypothetical protein